MDYPISLGLEGRRCVVIGGGKVAARRLDSLLECGAQVRLIATKITSSIKALSQGHGGHPSLSVTLRGYREGDLLGALLVIAATDDPDTNRRVAQHAADMGILVNVVDEPELCDFFVPSVLRRGELTLAVSSGGGSPVLSSHIRRSLEATIGPEYGRLTELAARIRAQVRADGGGSEQVRAATSRLLQSEALQRLRDGDDEGAGREAALCM